MSRCWRSASSSCATAVLAAAVRPRPSLPLSSLLASRRNASSSSSSSSSSHDSTAHESEVYPEEGFNAPFWTKIAVSGILLTLAIRLSPSDVHASSHDEQPYLTRYIQHNLTPATDLWKKRNERHLDLAVEAASDKLLFQEAQTAPIKRLRYLGTFDQASPNNVAVGSQADLTDLVIKSEKGDFAREGGDDAEEDN